MQKMAETVKKKTGEDVQPNTEIGKCKKKCRKEDGDDSDANSDDDTR